MVYAARVIKNIRMNPSTDARLLKFVGDRIRVEIEIEKPMGDVKGFLRTTLGNDKILRQKAMVPITGEEFLAGSEWRNVEMSTVDNRVWSVEFTLTEPGFFLFKGYLEDMDGNTFWPEGENGGISVHPSALRAENTIYCAFTRLFGKTRTLKSGKDGLLEAQFQAFDKYGHTVIPPSGTFRDLIKQLPHIINDLGCRVLHLLPVNPTPTTGARMGRYGSPYASLDLAGIDPALVEFDRRTTGIDQFTELTREAHHLGGRVMLDLVINHTGWHSQMFEHRPDWFVRDDTGEFKSPGAWGVVWGDLVELDHAHDDLWKHLADIFIRWCRRGVDGFRCDAGYMIPVPVWEAITARVRDEFPETIFFLEGLGGAFSLTEKLLTDGRMQWAYSELFQNYDGPAVSYYNDHSIQKNKEVGLLVHFSETHDNDRLAAKGKKWSLFRNRLCGLTSHSGGFGFMCGVEWLADEKINVHQCGGLNFGATENIVDEISTLNYLIRNHPCFVDGAVCRRTSDSKSSLYLLERTYCSDSEKCSYLLVAANTDMDNSHKAFIDKDTVLRLGNSPVDLLGQAAPSLDINPDGTGFITLNGGDIFCLSKEPFNNSVEKNGRYLTRRKQQGMAVLALSQRFMPEQIGPYSWKELALLFSENPGGYLGAASTVSPEKIKESLVSSLKEEIAKYTYNPVVVWEVKDSSKITPVPFGHWLMILHTAPFRTRFSADNNMKKRSYSSIYTAKGHVAVIPPDEFKGDVKIEMDSVTLDGFIKGNLRYLSDTPNIDFKNNKDGVVLLTNGRGGMSRFQVDLGRTDSKYDALLAVNANERWPVDREVLCKNIRAWLVTDGFSQPLDKSSLKEIALGSAAALSFKAGACNGVAVNISMEAMMVPNRNCTVLKFNRNEIEIPEGKSFSEITHIDLIIRVDLENRNFHETSKHNSAIAKKIIVNSDKRGFTFNRSDKNQLHVFCREGEFYLEPDYRRDIPHVFDSERGQTPTGNSFSPGWFKIDLQQASEFTLVMDADAYSFGNNQPLSESDGEKVGEILKDSADKIVAQSGLKDEFGKALAIALDGFVVKRDSEKTVIAGYPWFLDWGRDTLIAARGMLAGGRHKEVAEILKLFGKYVQNGTMPNSIHGHDHSNRDTSDAPLWYGIVVEDIVELEGVDFYNLDTGDGRTISKVLEDIGNGYKNGTSNGIYMDKESSLVWSPSHFTWMDTNHPAGTPREGYPIEIQVMWIRLLRHLAKLEKAGMIGPSDWETLANSAHESLLTMFYDEESGSMADLIKATSGTPAKDGALDTALRSNAIMAVSLGVIKGDKAKSTVMAAISHLVIPGAIRSLAPLTVKVPLGIYSKDGVLLNDPLNPYWGEYKGDEDTKRKPAYHNGTAWTWPFPMLCEAIVMAWPNDKNAQKAARSYLLSMDYFIKEGCIGQIPEIIDGDFPHRQRGCDAQAWGVSEALRVWKKLN